MIWTGTGTLRAERPGKRGWRPELFAAALTAGTLAGTLFGAGAGEIGGAAREKLFAMLEQCEHARTQAGAMACASGTFLSTFLLMLPLFAAGFCAWALPVAFAVPFFRGMGFGFTCAGLYIRCGAGAFGYSLCCLFPDLLMSGLLLAAAASQSAGLSGKYLSALAGDERRLPGRDELRRYCGRFLALLTAAAVAAMIGAIIAGSYPAGT